MNYSTTSNEENLDQQWLHTPGTPTFDYCKANTIRNEVKELEEPQKNQEETFGAFAKSLEEDVQVLDDDSDKVIFDDQIDVKRRQGAGVEIVSESTSPAVKGVVENNNKWYMAGTNTNMNEVNELKEPQKQQEDKFGEFANLLNEALQDLDDDSHMKVIFVDQIDVKKGRSAHVEMVDEPTNRNGEPKSPAVNGVEEKNTECYIKETNTIMNEAKNPEKPQKQEDKIENFENLLGEALSFENVANSLDEDFQVLDVDLDEVIFIDQIDVKRGREADPEILDEPAKKAKRNEEPDEKPEVNGVGEKNTDWHITGTNAIMNEAQHFEKPQKREDNIENFENLLGEALSFEKAAKSLEEDVQVLDEDSDEVIFVDQIDVKSYRGADAENKVGEENIERYIKGTKTIMNEAKKLNEPQKQEDKIENFENLLSKALSFEKVANSLEEDLQVLDDGVIFVYQNDVKRGRGADTDILHEPAKRAKRNEEPDESTEVNNVCEKNNEWFIKGNNTIANKAKEVEDPQKQQEDRIEDDAKSLEQDVQVLDEDSNEVIFVDQIEVKSDPEASAEIRNEVSEWAKRNDEPDECPELNKVDEKITECYIKGANTIINEAKELNKEPQKQQESKIENDANSVEENFQVLDEDSDEVIFVDQFDVKSDRVASARIQDEPTERAGRNKEPESPEVNGVGEENTERSIKGTKTIINEAKELDKEPQKQQEVQIENDANSLEVDVQVSDEDSDEVIFVDQIDVRSDPGAGAEIRDEPSERAEGNEEPESREVGENNTERYIKGTNTIMNENKYLEQPQKQQEVETFANLLDKSLQALGEDLDEVIFVDQIDVRSDPEAGAEIWDEPSEKAQRNEEPESPEVGENNNERYIKETNKTMNEDKDLEQPQKQQEVRIETFANLLDKNLQTLDEDLDEVIFVYPAANGVGEKEKETKWKPLMTYPKNRKLPKPKKIETDLRLLADLQKAFNLPFYQNHHLWNYPNKLYSEILVPYGSPEYQMISNIFTARVYGYEIIRIFKIENPFILLHYHIAKSKFSTQNDGLKERYYFHGTWEENLNNICRFNFDRSMIKRHKFGKGISLAHNSKYATDYPKGCQRLNRMMVVAKTFYKNPLEIGCEDTIIPEGPSYTTKNEAGTVLVKYDDASYYPAYVINYYRKY